MSLAENLLNSLDETAYQNTRIAGSGEEEHIKVGKDRVITVPNALKTIAVKGDKDVETATVDCVRYWDGHDLSTFAIYLNYILPNMDEGTYIPESITKSEDTFSFDWKIGSEFTYAQGKLTFWIVTKLTDDNGTLKKQWSSFQNSDCTIAQGGDKIYVPEKQEDQDVISQAISISRSSAEIAEQQANLARESAEKAASDAKDAAEQEIARIIGELGIVQELGDSPNSVISQAKVTKEFVATNAKIDRNTKRITNLEQGLTPDPFVTDDSVAYAKTVPEGALPYAEIHKIGGMTYRDETTNTLRSAKVTAVKSVGANLINLQDKTTSYASYVYDSFKINSLPAGTYTFSCNHNIPINTGWWVKLYDASKTAVGDTGTLNYQEKNKSFTTTGTAEYISIYVDSAATISNIMLNKGPTALPHTPYVEHTFPIPEAVQALDGYGESNPDDQTEYNAIFFDENGNAIYEHKGNIVDGVWVAIDHFVITDISDLITADNLIGVEGNGTITFENEYGYAVPSEVTYQLKGATA